MTIRYTIGDATTAPAPAIIAHVCNDIGAWGAGFSGALSRRYPDAEHAFRCVRPRGGEVQFVGVANRIAVANMVAQHGIRSASNPVPLQYDWLECCLQELTKPRKWLVADTVIHMPRIGCGLAGGDWAKVERLIQQVVTRQVVVYDLPRRQAPDL